MSTFSNWLLNINAYDNNKNQKKMTHCCLNGGILYIDNIILDLFYEKYSKALINKELIYIVEQKSINFPLFLDLDFKLVTIPNNNDIFEDIIKHINEVICTFYNSYYDCYVTTTTIKELSDNIFKKGYHVHWPELIVNKIIALEIRGKIIIKLKTIYGKIFKNDFTDIVDKTVLTSSGLRLVGSSKGHYIHKPNKQWIHEGRPYNLEYILKDNVKDITNIEKMTLLEIIKKTSIISNKDLVLKPNNYQCDECDECDEQYYDDHYDNDNDNNNWIVLNKSSPEFLEIKKFFRMTFKDYSENNISKIFKGTNPTVYIIWHKSKFCMNIGRNHNSCGVYFRINYNGISQKCHCKCDTLEGRKHGYCKDYSSPNVELTPYLLKFLKLESKIKKTNKNNDIINYKKEQINNNDTLLEDYIGRILEQKISNQTPIRTKSKKLTK